VGDLHSKAIPFLRATSPFRRIVAYSTLPAMDSALSALQRRATAVTIPTSAIIAQPRDSTANAAMILTEDVPSLDLQLLHLHLLLPLLLHLGTAGVTMAMAMAVGRLT